MFYKRMVKTFSVLALVSLLALTFATPALAFDGREGNNITISANEVINDDLYVGADNFTLDGTIKGDLIAGGTVITINGIVEGDLWAAGQTVIINGTVMDDVHMAGGALFVGDKAQIGGDIVSAGGSLELRQGSTVGNDLVFAGGQALLAGDIQRNVLAGVGGLELRGTIGGNVKAGVGDSQNGSEPLFFMPNSPISIPTVKVGLTLDPAAKIEGNLQYESVKQITIPGGIVIGQVTHVVPQVNEKTAVSLRPTPLQKVGKWFLDLLRTVVTLLAIGLMLVWLFPKFIKNATENLQAKPLASLGWGVVTYAAFFFAILLIILVMTLAGIFFGVLTLGQLTGTVIWLGILALFVLVIGFVLATIFGTKIVVGTLGGKLILKGINPDLAEHKLWPMLIGVTLIAILVSLPLVGWLLSLLVVFFGLGALWLLGAKKLAKKPVG